MPDMRELGVTGLQRQGGVVTEEYLRELQGDRWYKVVREMTDDPIVGAVLFAIEMLMRQVSWQVKPAKMDNSDAKSSAEFVEECLNDMSFTWSDTLSEILTMLPYGWSLMETVFKIRGGDSDDPKYNSKHNDGKIGWRKWSIRSQDTLSEWQFDDRGGIQGMVQQINIAPYTKVTIPIKKALLFRTSTRKNNPEGRSILRSSYRPFWFKRNIENIEGIGVERDLAGLPVAWVPPTILASDAGADEQAVLAAIKDIVVNIRRDDQEGVVYPLAYDVNGNKIYDLTLMSSGGTRQFDTGAIINRYSALIAMSVLADFILIGHEKQGSFALSRTKSDMFMTALRSWLDSIADVINRYAIPQLLKVNNMDITKAPTLVHGDVGRIDLEELGQYIVRLSSAGFELNLDSGLESYLRQQANLPLVNVDKTPGMTTPKLQPISEEPTTDAPVTPPDASKNVQDGVAGRAKQTTSGE